MVSPPDTSMSTDLKGKSLGFGKPPERGIISGGEDAKIFVISRIKEAFRLPDAINLITIYLFDLYLYLQIVFRESCFIIYKEGCIFLIRSYLIWPQ